MDLLTLFRDNNGLVFLLRFSSLLTAHSRFTTLVRFTHSHTQSYTDGRGCCARCQMQVSCSRILRLSATNIWIQTRDLPITRWAIAATTKLRCLFLAILLINVGHLTGWLYDAYVAVSSQGVPVMHTPKLILDLWCHNFVVVFHVLYCKDIFRSGPNGWFISLLVLDCVVSNILKLQV